MYIEHLKMVVICIVILYLFLGDSSFNSKNMGHNENPDDLNIGTPSVLTFSDKLFRSDNTPPLQNNF